jgi:LPXTG-motif cell wall-anchored protein
VTGVLTGSAAADNTNGGTGWFQPTVPLASLTFVFTWRTGFPVYQTWFATETASVSGSVTVDGASGLAGVTVLLLAPDGTIAGTTTTGTDGSYSVDGLAPQEYTAQVIPPAGYASAGGDPSVIADLSDGDLSRVDFLLVVLYEVGGTVTSGGRPVVGATIECFDQDQVQTGTVVTDDAGFYSCPPVAPGIQYSVILVAVPDGYELGGNTFLGFAVPAAPVTDLNFSVISNLTVAGSVVDEQGAPVANAPVGLVDDQGDQVGTTTTDATGAYKFANVPSGTYTVIVGPTEDFEQARLGGVVAGDGPVPPMTLVRPPPATVTPTPSTVTATPTTVTSTAAAVTVTSTVPSTTVVAVAVVKTTYLPDTGSHASELVPVGLALVVIGGGLLLFGRRRRGTHTGN